MFASQAISSTSHRRLAHKKVIASVDQVRSETVVYFLGLIFLVLLCSLFYIWSRIQIVNVGYQINKEVLLKDQLVEENKRLILEGAILKSPVRLEKMAKSDYLMQLPDQAQVLNQIQLKPMKEETKTVQKKEIAIPAALRSSKVDSKSKDQKSSKIIALKKSSSKNNYLNNSHVEKKNDQKQKSLRSEVITKTNKKLM